MQSSSAERTKRQQNRVRVVFPIKVRSTDTAGNYVEEIAHTLDITASGARLAAVRHELKLSSEVTVVYRQRKMTFLVVWVRLISRHEYQVGLRTIRDEHQAWGMNSTDGKVHVPC